MVKKILLWGVGILLAIQLIPVDRTNTPVDKTKDFVEVIAAPQPVRDLLRKACYDCHSNEVVYPWYSKIAPISWTIKDHVNEGRERLNFSLWKDFNKEQQATMLKNSVLTIEQRTMPMPGYMLQHPEANLTNKDRQVLIDFFQKLQKK
ncbi:heme-binding domain-containing protein [Elizabethkingia sp. JS20170427COW]|uniref:heme-binding domain-containing protein n=1 Tax=Elizabethkingia sp. JS20170427COW TaxID=2583851 RepID=UPI00111075F4|nr:heme-binding domain-containing protein [Elizabethkingia sp. JS20170427COW]QCX52991.1 cytochrome C [Elizabethkingia sp. JS20170427COW]